MVAAALLLCFGSALLLYLASAKQRLRSRPLPTWTRPLALLSAAAGVAVWVTVLGPGAGSFAALTALMLGWVGLPYIAWYAAPEERR